MQFFGYIVTAISAVLTFILLYQAFQLPFSLTREKKPPRGDKTHRFALVISARNEHNVIGHLLDSLNAQDYPREAFDVFVVADNCTDDTAAVAEQKGAKVFIRHDTVKVGKGFALSWFFDIFRKDYIDRYDAAGIFDADNLVDAQFLRVMNDYFCAGEEAVMGYRDSKNPHDNYISGCTSMIWWNLTRFYHIPRTKLGLSALAGGTGYMFRTEQVREGWKTTSICEDTEFSMQLMSNCSRIAFAYDAKFYDEQPTDITTSFRQRYRWAVGSIQCVKSCSPSLLRSLVRGNFPLALDGLLFLMVTPAVGAQVIVTVMRFFLTFAYPVRLWGDKLLTFFGMLLIGTAICYIHGLLLLLLERKPVRPMLKALAVYPFFIFTSAIINVIVLFYRNPVWHPIRHKKSISLAHVG